MPFGIGYDGPAPIDSFLVQRSASSCSSGSEPSTAELTEGESFISAFRGRAIQSTPLALPPGFEAKVVRVSQMVSSGASAGGSSSKVDAMSVQAEAQRQIEAQRQRERAYERRRIAKTKPPARQQKFSMDSDDDDGGDDGDDAQDDTAGDVDDDDEEEEESKAAIAAPDLSQDASPQAEPAVAAHRPETGPTIHIQPIAQVQPNHLTVWGPDGPIDKGDDPFFRTLGEWYSVVTPLVSLSAFQVSVGSSQPTRKVWRC